MPVLKTQVNPRAAEFRANADAMRTLVENLRAKAAAVELGGGSVARDRHVARGKLLPRDRVAQLLDPGAPFLEIGQLAAHDMYGGDAPSAGVIAGIGHIQGVDCMVVANDATVKGGTYYPMTVKKHLRAQEIAQREPAAVHLPGRLRRRQLAAAGRRCFPTASTSAASSTTRRQLSCARRAADRLS